MDRENVLLTLKDIFRHVAPDIDFDTIDLSRPLREQVEMDSLDFYNVVVKIHQQLGVNVPDSVLAELNNLNELVDYILRMR